MATRETRVLPKCANCGKAFRLVFEFDRIEGNPPMRVYEWAKPGAVFCDRWTCAGTELCDHPHGIIESSERDWRIILRPRLPNYLTKEEVIKRNLDELTSTKTLTKAPTQAGTKPPRRHDIKSQLREPNTITTDSEATAQVSLQPNAVSPTQRRSSRKHNHWQVTIFYSDGGSFARRYADHLKAEKFAERQMKSPVVERTQVTQVN